MTQDLAHQFVVSRLLLENDGAGGVPELVDDGVDGILVDAESAAALAEGLTKIARDPRLAIRLAIAAREKIEKSFQSDQSAKVLAKHLGVTIEK